MRPPWRGIRVMQGGPYLVLMPPQPTNLPLYQTFTQVNKRPTRAVWSQSAFTHGSSYRSQVGTESPSLAWAPVVAFSLSDEARSERSGQFGIRTTETRYTPSCY